VDGVPQKSTPPQTQSSQPQPKPIEKAPDPLPKKYQLNAQLGYQGSWRDGWGDQIALGFTFRSKDYFPKSGEKVIYHGIHHELILQGRWVLEAFTPAN
jgi:hypothetical protein